MTSTGLPDGFGAATRAWFADAFGTPTPAQQGAWAAVAQGSSALVVAPTGSGKTLSAFLWSLDRIAHSPAPPRDRRCRVLYVSPLKALAVDVERNLRAPLDGIRAAAQRLGLPVPDIAVGVRSGDTPAADRRRIATHPPDVLITTPESLFLMLTSQARDALRGVETVIVDEVHAVAGTKRGAHLALSLERLDALLPTPAQRIGLSATVRPVEEVARFLVGGDGSRPVEIVTPPSRKRWDLTVVVPVEDLGEVPAQDERGASIWPHLEQRLYELVGAYRSTIVFANSRRLAERITARLNEIAAESAGPVGAPLDRGSVPAQVMAESGQTYGAPTVIARAHHGSVSKEQRAQVEDDLKSGRLRCVVATSSLELGIDMGEVALVVQVEAPPSVASALQRVGRAGHQVGEVSRGVFLPKHRADLVHTAVAVERMREGAIEALRVPANPVDVLAQQIVAATAVDTWDVDALYALACRAAPYSALPRSVFDATLELLAGRYPSDDFAGLRPRVVWERARTGTGGTVSARPGAQRLAVTSGGTIPDRGLFGVFLAGEGPGRRVGELDEEMVYESRVGDVFSLGATSWRIEQITHDRVLVSPAPGRAGRLPFWKGDQIGRPAELGRAIGGFVREVSSLPEPDALARCRVAGLDAWAADNLVGFLTEQRRATQLVPSDRALVVERCRDELGDWRIVVHSPYGNRVHAPWALLLGARLAERYGPGGPGGPGGMDAQAVSSDDGIVLRIPDTDQEPPGAELLRFDPDEIERLVAAEVTGSALFASRFRECAARALLLPRRDPGRRSPLWQQRQRSAQLLAVAASYPDFPIVLEAVRECLQDVYDVPALVTLMRDLEARVVAVDTVDTVLPSPFAQSLLFGYVAEFMYAGDTPIAERRAAALTLDQGLLAELLGETELRELLDPGALAEVEAELQWLAPGRRARDAEGVADLLRLVGPLTTAEVAERCEDDPTSWLRALAAAGRIVEAAVAGEPRWAVVEDAARLRDALGVAVPPGVPEVLTTPVADPLGDLVRRYARTHGPFASHELARRLGLGVAVVDPVLRRLAQSRQVLQGEFRPAGTGPEWCDAEVLRRLRGRSLAALRKEVEPVAPAVLGRFLPAWQSVVSARTPAASGSASHGLRGITGVLAVVEQLAGCRIPASALEPLVLGSRVADYSSAYLDELTSSGEVLWTGHGSLPGGDGWVSLHLADTAPLTLPEPGAVGPGLATAVLEALSGGGAYFVRQLAQSVAAPESEVEAALWELAWAGRVGNDTVAPLRTLGATGSRRAPSRSRVHRARLASMARASTSTRAPGRWSLLPAVEADPTRRAHAAAENLLARYGVVTRGTVAAEQLPGGFAAAYRTLAAFEEAGRCRRGHFVAGLGAAQFAAPGAVDRLRGQDSSREDATVVLAAADPANPYGAALPWPTATADHPHRPGRKAGALVVLVDGALVLYAERGARTLLSWSDDTEVLERAAIGLVETARTSGSGQLLVTRLNGVHAVGKGASVLREAMERAGFAVTPGGLRLR